MRYLLLANLLYLTAVFGQTDSKTQISEFHGNEKHTGVYAERSYSAFGSLKWKFKSNGKIFSSPAISNGIVYIGSEDSNLYAIDQKTGKQLWKFTTGGAVNSSPAVYNNMVCFGSFDGNYYAINAKTGSLIWKFKTGGEKKVGATGLWTMKPHDQYMNDLYDFFLSSPIFNKTKNDLTVYFGSSDGNVYALNAASGKPKWVYKTNGLVHSSPALYNGKLYFGSWDTYMYAVDAGTGKLVWKFKTGVQPVIHLMEGIQSSPTCENGFIYFGARDGYFYTLNAGNGKLIWKYNANGSWVITVAAIKNGVVYTTTSDTYLFLALDAKTGKEKFRYKANGYLYSSPSIAGNTAFLGDFTGRLTAVNLTTGKISDKYTTEGRGLYASKLLNKDTLDYSYLSKGKDNVLYATSVDVMTKLYKLGSIVSSPVISNGAVYFGSADGCLYALNLK
ncbi:MAG TPA: PQQ-binding-like beta-propeller repeat protein [Mucilaginibacter sp.]|jgi:outer membrane protein assembly factor BamB